MSTPDSAEYWNDVKKHHAYTGQDFYHIPGYNCGHRHYYEAKYVSDVNCYSCKKALDEGLKHNLKTDLQKTAARLLKEIEKHENKKHENKKQIKCICGHLMVLRTNRKDGEKFYGFSKYQKCKHTKSLDKSI